MTSKADEVRLLRRGLRDAVALTMLPSVWTGSDAEQICNGLADVVLRMADADAVRLTVRAAASVEVLRLRSEQDAEAGTVLGELPPGDVPALLRTPSGRELRLLATPLSAGSDDRLIAAAYRSDFPSEMDRLLLRVAANQAAMWISRKATETRLAAESAFRRGIETSMLAGVAAVDDSGTQTYVNRAFAAMVGWPESELLGGKPPFVYWAPEDYDNIMAALADVLAGRARPGGYELRFRRRDEERFDALVLISPLEQDRQRLGFIASVYDITARKSAERANRLLAEAGKILARSLDYESTLQAVSVLAVPALADWCLVDLVQADGSFERVAVAHADPADAPVAQRLRRSYPPKSAPYGVSHTFAAGRTSVDNDVTRNVLVAIARDDEHLAALEAMRMRAFISVPMTSRGRTFGVISFVASQQHTRFDPAHVALAEELAQRAALAVDNARLYREAQEANRAKDEFLANLSHELRTPMTAILGWSHLLQLGGIPESDVEVGIQTIRQSAQAQAQLIDDLLDVSRIVTGKLHLAAEEVDVAATLRAAVDAIRPAADAKRQRLAVAVADGRLPVFGDAARLQQVFWNLLSNAVKFTPPGGRISVRAVERGATAVVTIADDGEGIPAELLPLVFERFRQATMSARKRTGLGLGLAIAKELVDVHGGTIAVTSEGENRGSTFTVTLPLHRESHGSGVAATRPDTLLRLPAVRVLLVEDDDATRTLLDTVLRSFGAEVVATASAADACLALPSFRADVLISDIDLPGADGVELLRSLRNGDERRFPAIAVTAYADDASRKRVLNAGFADFVAKPLDPLALAEAIERVVGTVYKRAERTDR